MSKEEKYFAFIEHNGIRTKTIKEARKKIAEWKKQKEEDEDLIGQIIEWE